MPGSGVTSTLSQKLRERALRIREAALGFSDSTSRTMLELADDLERRAAKLEKESPDTTH